MSLAESLRLAALILGFPNVAMCIAFAVHLWNKGEDPVYRPVFRSATYAYVGFGVLMGGICVGQIERFHAPMVAALPVIMLGELAVAFGMLAQFKHLPRRTW